MAQHITGYMLFSFREGTIQSTNLGDQVDHPTRISKVQLNVRWRLADCFDAIVAVKASAGNVSVIKVCRNPARARVAVIARVTASDVSLILTGSQYAVVTGATRTNDLGMVDYSDGCENTGAVAVLADVCRLNVTHRLAGRGDAIVTAAAVVDDIGVIEIGW